MNVSYMIYLAEGIIVAAAISLLFVRNLLAAVLLVMTILIFLAGMYLLLGDEFIGVTQLLIYAGGILVVVMFGIMLTGRGAKIPLQVPQGNLWGTLLISIPLLFILISLYAVMPDGTPTIGKVSLSEIGLAIMTDYVLPFEFAGILLLVALLGAAVILTLRPHDIH
jgi:NADH:ubiquinone oxidoreductase subunit 6 (subunit J)